MTTARERALRAAEEAAGVRREPEDERPNPWRGFGSFLKAPNLNAGRGDVIRVGKHRVAVLAVEWRDPTWAVTYSIITEKGSRLSPAEPVVTFVAAGQAPTPTGRWVGDLTPGSHGYVDTAVPSDGDGTNSAPRTTTTGPKGQKEGGSMPTVVKRSKNAKSNTAKGSAKPAAKTAAKGAKPAAAEKPAKATSTRRTQADIDKMAPDFLKAIQGGATMRAVKQQFGFSDDGPIRAALYRAGYTSKGAEHGEVAGSIDASKAPGKKRVVALRSEGAGWYRLAYLTGLSEPDVKKLVADAGGPTGRVYAEKAASNGDGAGSGSREGSGKKVTRRASKADPSK